MRRLVLALLPAVGFVLGAALMALADPAPAGSWLPLGGPALVLGGLACLALIGAAVAASAPRRDRRRRGPAIPRATPIGGPRHEPPTVSGYWRADAPDWPEGEVRPERESEDDPMPAGR
jgi:hypothetical protein